MLQRRRVTARHYRNRRIGEFLKELDLTEGKATGFPVIRNAMKNNGSPEPEFFTDEERTIFQATLKIHPWFMEYHPVEQETGKIYISAKDWNIQSLEDVDALLEYLLKAIYDQVNDQVRAIDKSFQTASNQEGENSGAIGGTKEGTIDKSKSDQVSDQVEGEKNDEDIVRDIVGDVVRDIYSSDNERDKYNEGSVGDIVNKQLSYLTGNQVYPFDIETDKDVISQLSYLVGNQVGIYAQKILSYCRGIKKRKDILENLLGISNQTKNYNNHIKSLIDSGLLLPLKKRQTSSKQSYQTSIKGKLLLLIMSKIID